jgi:3-oxoacyl-[acyl-carrier protein] reductase
MFAEHGASGLVLSDLDGAALSSVAGAARALGARVETVAGDVTKDDVIAAMVAAAGKLGGLHVLVNNAGGWLGVGGQWGGGVALVSSVHRGAV